MILSKTESIEEAIFYVNETIENNWTRDILEIQKKFGELKSILYKENILLPDADILIASVSLTKCTKLISGNIKHFNRFENLLIDNWIR